MANRYPGYCVDCGREVRANHGELLKRGGKYVVSCGNSKAAVAPKSSPKPNVVAPEGMRLTDMRISSSNAALNVTFSVGGLGRASSFAPYAYGTAIKYTRWSNEPLRNPSPNRPEEAGKSLRELHPQEAAAHDALCAANEDLLSSLRAAGQVAGSSDHEFSFPLSAEEQKQCADLISSTKAAMLSAILDGTAEIRVDTVGYDYPHPQILEIKIGGKGQEYAVIQSLLGDLDLKVDGHNECKDLVAAIRARQDQARKREQELQAHQERRAQGFHIVILRQCWECGRTQILGELDDDMRQVRMPADVYAQCQREQSAAHARSLEGATELLSSVGFAPAPESKFDFRIVESDWYCGC